MKSWLPLVVIAAMSVPQWAPAQDKAPYDLSTLLRDSAYVLNRFDEVATGMVAQIDGSNTPVELKRTRKEALAAVLRNVGTEKPALNALLGQPKVSSADLLDAYAEMVEVASELEGESSDVATWGDGRMATDLAQLGAKARILGAKIGVALRSQIVGQELRLVSCSPKAKVIN